MKAIWIIAIIGNVYSMEHNVSILGLMNSPMEKDELCPRKGIIIMAFKMHATLVLLY
jgi:hypothetical protein